MALVLIIQMVNVKRFLKNLRDPLRFKTFKKMLLEQSFFCIGEIFLGQWHYGGAGLM